MEENIYKKIIQNASFGYAYHKIILDNNGNPIDYKFLDLNKEFEKLTGLSREQIINKKVSEILPGIRDEFDWVAFYGEVALNGREKEFEQYSKPLNKYYRVQVSSPKKGFFVTVFTDIIAILPKVENRLYQITENISEVVWLRSADNKEMIYISPAYEKVWGRSRESLYKNPSSFMDAVYEADKAELKKEFQEYIKNGKFKLEYRIVHPSGEVKWVRAKGFPVKDQNGDIIRYAGIAIDITERKRIEEELQKSKEMLQSILNSLSGTLNVVDEDYNIIAMNNAGFRLDMTEYNRVEEIIGKRCHQVFMDRTSPCPWCKVGQVFKTGEAVQETTTSNDPREKKTGRALKIFVSPIFGKSGTVKAVAEYGLDITELRNAKKEAEQANKAKSEFLANMSHEIRTPLNAIIGFSEILEAMISEEQQKSYLDSIKVAGNSLLTIINDILDLSKIESGMLEVNYEVLNLNKLLEEMEQIFSTKIEDQGLDFIVEVSSKLPLIKIDGTRLRQILLNLISNAIKFTKEGYIKIDVNTQIINDQELNLEIIVKDTGIGIAKKDQATIFESFKQQDGQNDREYGGTGLGLAITKRLTKLLQGEISLDSKLGEGSEFRVAFDKLEYVEKTIEQTEIDNEPNIKFNGAKILVVDDVKSNRDLIVATLEDENIEIIQAKSGFEAIDLLTEKVVDLILMDIKMPEMNGYQTKRVIEEKLAVEIPIIAITALTTVNEVEKIKQSGFVDFIAKPVKRGQLIKVLMKYLDYQEKENEEIDSLLKFKVSLTDNNKLAELKEKLEAEFLPVYEKLNQAFVINEAEEFAVDLKDLAQEYKLNCLLNYAVKLEKYINNFNLLKIKEQFARFPKLLTKLESKLN